MPVNLLQERHILPSTRIELAEPNLPGDLKNANCSSEYVTFATVFYKWIRNHILQDLTGLEI